MLTAVGEYTVHCIESDWSICRWVALGAGCWWACVAHARCGPVCAGVLVCYNINSVIVLACESFTCQPCAGLLLKLPFNFSS